MQTQYALMWIVLCAWMKALMNLQTSVEPEKLLQSGLPSYIFFWLFSCRNLCVSHYSRCVVIIPFPPLLVVLPGQWADLFLLRRLLRPDSLCLILHCHSFMIFLMRDHPGVHALCNNLTVNSVFFVPCAFIYLTV